MSKTIYEATLSEALPDSISGDVSVQAVCAGIDPQIRAMCAQIDVPAWMSRVQTMSSDELDHVAYTFGSHVWMKDWSLEQKRAYIVEVVANKKIIGTPAAIIDVFTQLGYTVRYEDCMSHESMEPGTFLVSLVNEPVPLDDQWQMRWIVDNVKPASRTWRWDNRIEARHTARAVAAFTGCMWQRHEAVLTEEVVENFGEIIPVFFSTNGVDSPQIDLRYADAPAYDEAGNPVYLEEGWIYESSEKKWHSSRITTNVLTLIYTFPNVSSPMSYLRNKTVGSAVQIYTTDHMYALGAYLFRAKEPFYFAWLKANGIGGTTSVNAGSSVPLYPKGSMNLMGYSELSPLKLRAAIGGTAEYLDISTLEIVQKDTYYAYLKNNGTEAVDVYCLIFSDSGGE